jgi:acetoin utilization protein AcuB
MTAEEIMTEDVTVIEETVTLGQALEIMEEKGIRHLPVVRGREVCGMLSDRDLRGFGVSLVTDLETLDRLKARLGAPVSTAMSADVFAVAPTTEVTEVVDLLVEEKISAVPVVDEESNEIVGIVSYVDVLRAMRDSVED